MPLYVGDYLGDTTHLSTTGHGAYLLLIMTYWRQGPLADDDRTLANIAKCEKKLWDREIGPVIRRFFTVVDGHLRHKRIDAELAVASANSAKKREAAEKRWEKSRSTGQAVRDAETSEHASAHASEHAPAYAGAYASDDANGMQKACPYAGASPSPSKKEDSSLRSGRAERAPNGGGEIRNKLFGEGTAIVCRITGKTPGAARSLIGKLLRDAKDDAAAVLDILRRCELAHPAEPTAWIAAAVADRRPLSRNDERRQRSRAKRNAFIAETYAMAEVEQAAGGRQVVTIDHEAEQL